ncbi:hypothetical protein BD413DRAFT_575028, partial [Trametes elegans]
ISDEGYNIRGAVAGVLGIMGIALAPIVRRLINCQMPSEKLRALNARLVETKQHLTASVNDGLIEHDQLCLIMWTTKCCIEKLRAKIHDR